MVIRMNKKTRDPARSSLALLPRNRSGWIEIVEAFVAVLLVVGVVLIVLNKGYLERTDISERVYEAQLSILREIQTNDTFRKEISTAGEPPIGWTDSRFPPDLKEKIVARTPNYLDCVGKICGMTEQCTLDGEQEKDIYSQSVAISSTLGEGEVYRKLNLFCWTK